MCACSETVIQCELRVSKSLRMSLRSLDKLNGCTQDGSSISPQIVCTLYQSVNLSKEMCTTSEGGYLKY